MASKLTAAEVDAAILLIGRMNLKQLQRLQTAVASEVARKTKNGTEPT